MKVVLRTSWKSTTTTSTWWMLWSKRRTIYLDVCVYANIQKGRSNQNIKKKIYIYIIWCELVNFWFNLKFIPLTLSIESLTQVLQEKENQWEWNPDVPETWFKSYIVNIIYIYMIHISRYSITMAPPCRLAWLRIWRCTGAGTAPRKAPHRECNSRLKCPRMGCWTMRPERICCAELRYVMIQVSMRYLYKNIYMQI